MALAPNLLVGAVGLLVVFGTGTVLVTGWADLTHTATFSVEIETNLTTYAAQGSTAVNGAQASSVPLNVSEANLTELAGSLRWDAPATAGEPVEVNLTIYHPDGRLVFQSSRPSGATGIDFQFDLGDVPAPTSYRTQEGSEGALFQADYPPDDSNTGEWRCEILATYGGPSPLPPGNVRWQLDANWAWYSATLTKVDEPAQGVR